MPHVQSRAYLPDAQALMRRKTGCSSNSLLGGVKWARTIDLYDVNVTNFVQLAQSITNQELLNL